MAYIDKNAVRHIQFIAVDNKLQQIAKDGLYLTLARRRYISSLVEMPNGTYRYQMVPKEQVTGVDGFGQRCQRAFENGRAR